MKLDPGDSVPAMTLETLQGTRVSLPDASTPFVHLQFRRFAGCPVCNLHLMSFARRQQDIQAAGIRELVVFHSSRGEMIDYQGQLPFDCVADPSKTLYRQFGVETSRLAVLHPSVLWSGLRWFVETGRFYKRAENGVTGLPADFLIDARGQVLAAKYGRHADDQWEVDELLQLVTRPRDRLSARPGDACL